MAFKEGVVLGTVSLNATGSGTTAIGATSNSGTISIGNTSSGAVNIDCGTAGINVGSTANNHTTTIGTTNGTATTNIRSGSGGIGLTGAVTSANAITITSGNLTLSAGNVALPTTSSTVGNVTINSNRVLHAYGNTTAGAANVFAGLNAGNYTLNTGSSLRNAGFGAQSLASLTTGADNTGVGVNSLNACQNGGGNCILGVGAGTNITSGSNNIAIGRIVGSSGALGFVTTGSYNIAIGPSAGNSLATSDSSNILLGHTGTGGTSNIMRLGTAGSGNGQVNTTFIAGPTMNIATDSSAGTITMGNTTGATVMALRYGTGDFTLASATGTVMSALDTGEITYPLQPAFLAIHTVSQTNITGNGAIATINFTSEIFDQNSDYDGTNTFIAPITGRYMLIYACYMDQVSSGTNGVMNIVTSNRSYGSNFLNYSAVSVSGQIAFNTSALTDMDSGDTATCTMTITGIGADTADALASGATYFSGYLVC